LNWFPKTCKNKSKIKKTKKCVRMKANGGRKPAKEDKRFLEEETGFASLLIVDNIT